MSNNLVINTIESIETNLSRNQYINQNWFQQHFTQNKLFENNLNFTTAMANSQDEDDIGSQRKKPSSRDPLSHRIIEKRRRDRMNNCLADLSRLIPTSYLKKSSSLQGRGRIEKTEIIEMAIKHMKHLQAHKYCTDDTKCQLSNESNLDQEERVKQYRLGYQECLSEAIRFLVEIEGLFTGDGLCRRMMDYLHNHMTTLQKVNPLNDPESCPDLKSESRKVRSPSVSESTTSANEKMDLNDNDLNDRNQNIKPIITSHLREMLESNTKRKLSPNVSLSSVSPPISPNTYHQNEVYNFKKEIKDRFHADQKGFGESSKSISPSNVVIDDERISNSSLSSSNTQTSDHRSDTSGYSSNCSNKSLPMPSVVVPIFALHPSGNYYLPLTLEASIIGPYITKECDVNPFPILHPINITVNFSYKMDTSRPLWPPIMSTLMAQHINSSINELPNNLFNNSNSNTDNTDNHNNNNSFNNNNFYDNSKSDIWSNPMTGPSKFSRLNKIK